MQSFHLIVVAGGSGERMGGSMPKQYRPLGGVSSFARAVQILQQAGPWKRMIAVIHPDHRSFAQPLLADDRAIECVTGGVTRSASVRAALKQLASEPDDDFVIIHDAARPFLSADLVHRVKTALHAGERSVTAAIPITDTLCRLNGERIDRQSMMALQTPQGFYLGSLRAAYHTHPEGGTDETAVMQQDGIMPFFVAGDPDNIKLTTPQDWERAERMIQHTHTAHRIDLPREFRTGHGFDIHAFEDVSSRPLVLCGVVIPHSKSLRAHSDGDVALHALADALYGTMGTGDIGTHFPPDDPAWADADSTRFIHHALDHLGSCSGRLHHIDLTILAEAPKINPYRAAMCARLQEVTGLSKSRIGLKATTLEGLGALGRGEGIAVHALVTVSFPC